MKTVFFSVMAILLCVVGLVPAADQPALPNYTAAPFTKIMDCESQTGFHPERTDLTCELFADSPVARPGANAVYVFKDKSGALTYATWVSVQPDRCPVLRGYNRTGKAWVFEKEKRPCDEKS